MTARNISKNDDIAEIQVSHDKARRSKKASMFQFSLIEKDSKMTVTDIIDVAPAKLKIAQAKEAILTFFDADTELTRKDIIAAVKKETGIGDKNTSDAIRQLANDNVLVAVQRGREKHYKLASTEQEQ
jgi:hypothetical protein